ncbi:MAG: excalibur calcium-binding domain-containing protein [Burkholderiales bacterium]|nr:excalibur calcium-binding domain-containing protein [Burkholderiales bacterium]
MRTIQPLLTLLATAMFLSCLASHRAMAQIRKCEVDGKVVYQQSPCPATERGTRPTAKQLNAQRREKALQSEQTSRTPSERPSGSSPPQVAQPATAKASPMFRCDGRTYCSQMSSCAEAKFFLSNCPGVKMDGDHDGIPCEEQWCK